MNLIRKSVLVPLLGLFLCIFGAKLFVIGHHGNPTPFWDQWDAEAASLYLPLAEGGLDLAELFAPHNEHRILWVRLLGLLELSLNGGIWDPLFQMVVNAGIHSLAILLLLFWLRKDLPPSAFVPLVLFSSILVLPFGWENTLAGFQSQFYFLLLFGILSIWWLTTALPLSAKWWLGFAALAASGFSVASGFLAGLAVAAGYFLQMLADKKADWRKCAGTGILLAYAVLAYAFTPAVEAHAPLKAAGIHDFSLSLFKALAFPFTTTPYLAIFTQLPVLACAWRLASDQRAGRNPRRPWFLMVATLWLYLNAAATAYGRGAHGAAPASRYMDTLALLNIVNFAAGLHWVSMFPGRRIKFALAGWSIVLLAGWLGIYGHSTLRVIRNEARLCRIQETNVRQFLEDFDRERMERLPYYSIPYPTAPRLIDLLENETVRDFLPTPLRRPISSVPMHPNGFTTNGVPPTLELDGHEPVWGSYGPEGCAGVGSVALEYEPPPKRGFIEILVTGQPFEDGMKLQVQDKATRPLRLIKAPRRAGTRWRSLYFRNPGAPFQIIAEDGSPQQWLAFAAPKEIGAGTLFARVAMRFWFVFAGFGIGLLAWVSTGIPLERNRSPERDADTSAAGDSFSVPTTSAPLRKAILPALLIFILAFALFSPSLSHKLVDLDDGVYISFNTTVLEGLSPASIRHAFSPDNVTATMYMPLLWVSYMLDVEWFGSTPDQPWGFHFTNVFLHALNSILVFFLLYSFCRKPWRAFFFASLWAIHPLRVESVAWVTERKDVLSGLFSLLCLGSYLRAWQNRLGSTRPIVRLSIPFLAGSVFFFALGLLVKPALVPIPLVLLLLDFWPLRRLEFTARALRQTGFRLLLEKIPFLIVAGLAALGTIWGHHVVTGKLHVPLLARLLSIPMAYGFYLLKTVWPRGLTVLYLPFSDWMTPNQLWMSIFLAIAGYVALTERVWNMRRKSPNALVGWLWFIVMLVPVCGIVPIPANDVADRFSYLPAIGLSIALLHWNPFSARFRSARRWAQPASALAILGTLAFLSLRQLPAWKDAPSQELHMLSVFPNHPTALRSVGARLIRETGDFQKADELISKALAADPGNWEVHLAKAQCMAELDNMAAAQRYLLDIEPPYSLYSKIDWFRDLARYALMQGEYAEAIRYVDQLLELIPANDITQTPILLMALAAAYDQGDAELALAYARRFPPYANKTSVELLDLLPHAVFQWFGGYRRDAYAYFQRVVQTYPDRPDILNNLAWGLATASWSPADPTEVLAIANRLVALVPDRNPGILDTLAAAQANAGNYESARRTTQEALALFPPDADLNQLLLKERLASRLALYEQNQPYREDAFTRMYVSFFGAPSQLRSSEP